jgi:formylmethanofuran dehydrogenase subunit C
VIQCIGYFPVVHSTGSQLKFAAGNRGQGTLLVDGDLELAGGFEWDGLIIVKGAIKINGTGNKLTGAVFAQGVNILTAGAVSGNVEIKYSKCAVDKAVGGATLAAPLGQRSFTHLY